MIFWIVGSLLLAILLLLLGIALFFFRTAFHRRPAMDFTDEAVVSKTVWKPYYSLFRDGISWFRSQNPEDVWVKSRDGLRLHAKFLPHARARGTILLFHGYHSSGWSDFGCVAKFYHNLGFHLLLVDQRAHGDSEGTYISFGVLEREDCLVWVDYLNGRLGEMPLFLDGLSMGATTVLLAAGMPLPRNVKGIIADCGFLSPEAIFRHVLRTRYHLPAFPLLAIVNTLCRVKAGFSFRHQSTTEALCKTKLPLLLLHGTEDRLVPDWMSKANADAHAGETTLVVVEGAWHAASYLVNPAVCEAALEQFLNKYCGGGIDDRERV